MTEVRVTIRLKSPVGYSQQDVLVAERAMLINAMPSNESFVQGPRITYETCAETEVNDRPDLFIATSGDGSVDTHQMFTLPIPTSAVSSYLCVMLTRETGPLMHFTSGRYTLIIVDMERRYLHMVVSNMRVQSPYRQLIVPYQAPPVGERSFNLRFCAYRQTAGLMTLDDEEVTQLQTRSFNRFITICHAYNLHNVGSSWLDLGPEVMAPGPAPAA